MSDISLVALPYFQSYGTESQNGLLFHSSTSLSNEISYPIHSSTHQQTSQWISDTQMQPYQSIPRQFEQYQSTSSLPQAQESFQYYNHQLSNSDNQQAQQYQQPQQYYHSPPSHQLPILPPPPIYQAPPAIIQEVSFFVLFILLGNSFPPLFTGLTILSYRKYYKTMEHVSHSYLSLVIC